MATVTAAACFVLVPAGAASAQPTSGGCQDFGAFVSGLAGTLGPVFGATASGVATSGPQAFPTAVVHPEQEQFCS